MIIVDIYVPAVDETYDFYVDEYSRIGVLANEVAGIIGSKMGSMGTETKGKFMLCKRNEGRILSDTATLASYKIRNGESLMLV